MWDVLVVAALEPSTSWMVAWTVYAGFVAAVGTLCSLLSRSTLRATLATFLSLALVSGGPWAVWSFANVFLLPVRWQRHLAWLNDFHLYGMIPPVTFVTLAIPRSELIYGWHAAPEHALSFALGGVVLYTFLSVGALSILAARFGTVAGRMPTGRIPE